MPLPDTGVDEDEQRSTDWMGQTLEKNPQFVRVGVNHSGSWELSGHQVSVIPGFRVLRRYKFSVTFERAINGYINIT